MICIAGCSAPGSKKSARVDDSPSVETTIAGTMDPTRFGLEMRVLTVDDTGDRVASALSRFSSQQGPFVAADRDRWWSWGLRWIVIPKDELDSFIANQDATSGTEVRQMGQFPQWRPLIQTGSIRDDMVRIGGSTDTLRSMTGKPRLLARSFMIPQVDDSGVSPRLRVDLGIQITTRTKQSQISNAWQTPKLPSVFDEGPMVDQLMTSIELDGSEALILLGEDPSIEWIAGDIENPARVQVGDSGTVGPGVLTARTLGEQMFSTRGTGAVAPGQRYVPPKKVMIILVPNVADQYRLLATSPNRAGDSP